MKSCGVTIQMDPLQQYFHVVLKWNPGNSNSEGKRKKKFELAGIRVIGVN